VPSDGDEVAFRIEPESRAWLYRLGSCAALVVAAVYLAELAVVARWGLPPSTVRGVFAVFSQ
jgi:hypothetical protein